MSHGVTCGPLYIGIRKIIFKGKIVASVIGHTQDEDSEHDN